MQKSEEQKSLWLLLCIHDRKKKSNSDSSPSFCKITVATWFGFGLMAWLTDWMIHHVFDVPGLVFGRLCNSRTDLSSPNANNNSFQIRKPACVVWLSQMSKCEIWLVVKICKLRLGYWGVPVNVFITLVSLTINGRLVPARSAEESHYPDSLKLFNSPCLTHWSTD